MATITASVLIGTAHRYHGGINPTHLLLLSENDRPAWQLTPLHTSEPKTVWIPTVENMLDDGLLMVGMLVIRDEWLLHGAKFKVNYEERALLYDDIAEADRRHLYELCRKLKTETKLIISVFKGSSIANQLDVVGNYAFPVEVCRSA
jgi:hypothetical protein